MDSGRQRTWGSKRGARRATSSSSSVPPLVFIEVWGFQRFVGKGDDNEESASGVGRILFLLLLTTLRTEVRTSALALWAGYPVLAIRLHTPRTRAANGNPWRTAMGRGALVVRPEACRHIRFSRTMRARFYIYIRHIRRLLSSPGRGGDRQYHKPRGSSCRFKTAVTAVQWNPGFGEGGGPKEYA
jgi:hypothetical protein